MQKKSWGREIGITMLGFIFYLGVNNNTEVLQIVMWPFMTFIFWAFGVVKNAENISTIIGSVRR